MATGLDRYFAKSLGGKLVFGLLSPFTRFTPSTQNQGSLQLVDMTGLIL